MASVRWTPQASDDLEAIVEYIALDSDYYARLFASKILAAIDRLEIFPNRGRIVPEINNPLIREIFMGNYRIVYRCRDEVVEILTIYHGARLLDPSGFESLS